MKNPLTKNELMIKLDLSKEKVVEISQQKGISKTQKSQVVVCLDFSGSMDTLYATGKVQKIVERVLPIAMAWDDNGECECYIFSTNCNKIKESITTSNVLDFVDENIYGKFRMSGTNYAPPIEMITKDFQGSGSKNESGFFGGLFGGGSKKEESILPTYVIFITDGDNDDKYDTEKAIIAASKYPIFFQFVGIGKSNFPFLEKLDNMKGRKIDNANFFSLNDFNKVSDDELYDRLLNEYPSFIKEAKRLGYI